MASETLSGSEGAPPAPVGIVGDLSEIRTSLKRRLNAVPDDRLKEFQANLLMAQLLALDGDSVGAVRHLEVARARHPGKIERRFSDFITAGLLCRRFEWAASELSARYGLRRPIRFQWDELPDAHAPAIKWCVNSSGASSFTCNRSLWTPRFASGLIRFAWMFPLIAESLRGEIVAGCIFLNLGDVGRLPGLAFCDNRPEYTLIPDASFISTMGYADTAAVLTAHAVEWGERIPLAYWRGATTGDLSRGWRNMPRARLCLLSQSEVGKPYIDASLTKISGPIDQQELNSAGVLRPFAPIEESMSFKYQIDIDGHTNSWPGLFQKLLTGSPVLKVESPAGYRQWYYDRLRPWSNFVPVASDLSDLVENIRWLITHDNEARAIGGEGLKLAMELDYHAELRGASLTIAKAFSNTRH